MEGKRGTGRKIMSKNGRRDRQRDTHGEIDTGKDTWIHAERETQIKTDRHRDDWCKTGVGRE